MVAPFPYLFPGVDGPGALRPIIQLYRPPSLLSFPPVAPWLAYRIAVGSTTQTTTRLATIKAAATAETRAILPRLAGNLPRMIQNYDGRRKA